MSAAVVGTDPREDPMYPSNPQIMAQLAQRLVAERIRDAEARRLASAFARPTGTDPRTPRPRRTRRLWFPRPAFG